MIDGDGFGMLHEFSGEWFDLFHVMVVVNISKLQLFLFQDAVYEGPASVHPGQ